MYSLCTLKKYIYSTTAPTAPRSLSVEQSSLSGATELEVSWMRPSPANGIITGYTLYCSGSGTQYYEDQVNPGPFTHSIGGGTTGRVLMGLLPFTNYTCSISASTSAGEGERSTEVTTATDESSKIYIHNSLRIYHVSFYKMALFMMVSTVCYFLFFLYSSV